MPCTNEDHEHKWPATGNLFICRCEFKCGYCSPDAEDFSSTQTLRTHVKEQHVGGGAPDYPDVELENGHRGKTGGGRCPCELRNEGLLKPSPVSAKKKATGNPAGRPRKIARRDSQDATESYMTASNATDSDAPLTLLRTQLSAVVEWALEEERVKDVGDALNDAIRDMMSRK